MKLHQHSGQFRVFVRGAYVYLGRDEATARRRYAAAINSPEAQPASNSVAELCRHVLAWAATEFTKTSRWRGEAASYRYALRFLDMTVTVKTQHGPVSTYLPALPADDFNVQHLAAVQRSMVDQGLSRTYINGQVKRIVRAFTRARIDGLVSAATVADLRLMPAIRRGHPTVHETGRVLSVDDRTIEATLPALSPLMQAVVMILRNDGMRVGELMPARLDQIDDRARAINLGTEHKTGQRTFPKTLLLCEDSWSRLLPYIEAARATMNTRAFLFPSELNPLGHVQADSVRCAIREACKSRGIPHWFTHQLRHAKATEMARQERKRLERESLRVVAEQLGHRSQSAAKTYVDPAVG